MRGCIDTSDPILEGLHTMKENGKVSLSVTWAPFSHGALGINLSSVLHFHCHRLQAFIPEVASIVILGQSLLRLLPGPRTCDVESREANFGVYKKHRRRRILFIEEQKEWEEWGWEVEMVWAVTANSQSLSR